ncbi:MAG: hypothetical protein HDS93_02735 [Bacteroidales bacterium]|nr:hypothetical protein [Bacteroidales bacterium]MBD5190763.1 hypothetical protein [Bacteroidales bacterium]MBD5208713.1 hypothetical protein [Bacteroidales bacterium]
MKKLILTLALAISAFVANAVNPFLEFQPVIANSDNCSFNIQGGVKTKVHPNIDLGVGVGITEQWSFSNGPLIPIFARGEFSGRISKFKPFFSFDVGYEINTEDTHCGAVLVNPMVGLKFGNWYGGIGYLAHCWTPKHAGTSSNFALKIGYNF